MKHNSGKFVLLIFVFLTLMVGCTKEKDYNLLKGDLEGMVYSDGNYSDIPAQISIDGNNFSKTTSTDNTGKYSFTGLTTGTYNLKFTKDGYGTCFLYGLSFIGGNYVAQEVPSVNLSKLPNASVSDLYLRMFIDTTQNRPNKTLRFYANFSPDKTLTTNYMAYLSTNAKVSYKNYKLHYYITPGYDIHLGDYDTVLFKKNSTLYMIIYPYHTAGSEYTDMNTGCVVYSEMQEKGASNIASVVVK